MAMEIQKSESGAGANTSKIQILDIRMAQVNQPIKLITTIAQPTTGVNGVGMTKESGPDGRYFVAGINGNTLMVYRSTTSGLLAGPVSFDQVGRVEDMFDSGPGLALVTQTDGSIFMFALNADDNGENNCMNLYQLHNWQGPGLTATCALLGKKPMNIPGMSDSVPYIPEFALLLPPSQPVIKIALEGLAGMMAVKGQGLFNSSFRWGKGLAITSANSIEVYATDRNVLPLSQVFLPGLGTDKDFSLVTWRTAPVGTNYLPMNTALNVGELLCANNSGFFAIMQGNGNLCVYAGGPEAQGPLQWCSQATGLGSQFFTIIQHDGNLCTYYGSQAQPGACLWNSQTARPTKSLYFLIMQDDGNLCVYSGSEPNAKVDLIWCSMN